MGSLPTLLNHLLEPSDPDEKVRSPLVYLIANGIAWLAVIGIFLHDSAMLPAAVLSVIVLCSGLSWMIYDASRGSAETCDSLNYQLKLSIQTIDRLKEEISSIRQRDPLTQCMNEKRFREEIASFIALNERSGIEFSVIRLKLDQYNLILGRDGQRGSNELLQVFSRILKASLREVDSVARFDEEQFAVLLSGSNATGAIIVANRIIKLTEQLTTTQEDERITVSVGITEFYGEEDQVRLIQNAETALATAIDQGGDCVAGYNHGINLQEAS